MEVWRRIRSGFRVRRRCGASAGLLVLIGAVLVLAVPSCSADEEPGLDDADTTNPESESLRELEGLPEDYPGGQSAAPREVGGEPFRLCDRCHPDFLEQPGPDEDLIFSHPVHLENDVGCVSCHDPPLGHFGNPAPLMMSCLEFCHQGETAPNDCNNCHRRLEDIAPGLEEPVVHLDPDAENRESCAKCHDVEEWCGRCHGLEMPHPPNWLNIHGPMGQEENEVCVKCHQSRDEEFCISCHRVEMPHPAYWFSRHGEAAQEDESVCSDCHRRAPQYCNECHHAGYSPTALWTSEEHGEVVGEQGTEACLTCHDRSFCGECHPGREFGS